MIEAFGENSLVDGWEIGGWKRFGRRGGWSGLPSQQAD